MPCLSEEMLIGMDGGTLPAAQVAAAREHLASCESCLARVAQLSRQSDPISTPSAAERSARSRHRQRIARFRVNGPIGAGGMGVVYSAWDPQLGRAVALKLLRSQRGEGAATEAQRGGVLREAQAMARLRHPNVIAIYEVGEWEGQVFIAMELVEGGTLSRWLREKPRSWREVLAIFREAAQGLAAAHRAGLVHRDFKPDNVLIANDGAVRVADFGLARSAAGSESHPDGPALLRSGLTNPGKLGGTPRYMSPEQRRGDTLDARVDQYALAVSLFESLYGRHPNEKEAVGPVATGRVPAQLRAALERGFHADPARRFPSIDALIEALGNDPHRERHRARAIALWVAGVSLLSLLLVLGFAIRARLEARSQAAAQEERGRLAAQLGQDVKEVEWFLRAALLLPVHDVTREEEIVRARMAAIAQRTTLIPLADYALGRGHLALHEDAAAKESLDRALQGGVDTPELHFALGLALGRLYEKQLAAAKREGEGAWLEGRTRELDKEFLEPAVQSLEKSRGVELASHAYLAGVIAYYQKDYATAIARAREARAQAPWLYEGTALEADALLARALSFSDLDPDGGSADLVSAGKLYDEAIEVGRSDVQLYRARLRVWVEEARVASAVGKPPQIPLEAAEAWARSAIQIAPKSSELWEWLASARTASGRFKQRHGVDPRPDYHAAVDAARQAIALDESNGEAHRQWGLARAMEAWADRTEGRDFRLLAEESYAQFKRSAELTPRSPAAINSLALGLFRLGQCRHERGEDPLDFYLKAEEQADAAVRLAPDVGSFRTMPINLQYARANWLRSRGQSPEPLRAKLEANLAGCQLAAPKAGFCLDSASYFYETLTRYELESGGDPRPALARASELILGNGNDLVEKRQAMATLALLRLLVLSPPGAKTGPLRAEVDRAAESCVRLAPHDSTCRQARAEADLFEGTAEGARRARAVALEILVRDPTDDDMSRLLAEAELRLGQLDEGLAVAERGLRANPTNPWLLAVRGKLLLARSKRAGEADAGKADAQRGREALAQAFAINPNLVRTYGPLPASEGGNPPIR